MSTPAGGWYDDPAPGSAPGAQRYWDGRAWTEQTRAAPTTDLTKTPNQQQAYGQQASGQQVSGQQAYGQAPAGYAGPPPPAPPVPLTHTPDGMALASPGKRLGAFVIDYVILSVAAFAVLTVFLLLFLGGGALSGVFDTSTSNGEPPPGFFVLVFGGYALLLAVLTVLSLWYYVLRVRQVGATPGKQILGLRVRTFHTDGQLTWAQVWGRYGLPALVNSFVGVTWFVDVLWLVWDKHRQTLHDKAVGTVVVDTSAPRVPQDHPGVQLARAFPVPRGWVADGPNPQTPSTYPR